MTDYKIPWHKRDLVPWLTRYWPQDRAKFTRMGRGQLYAIACRVIANIRKGTYPGKK